MGYMGLGMQRWISTMKPKKFLGKRSKPDGGGVAPHSGPGISQYYHLEKRSLDNLKRKKYSDRYRIKLGKELKSEKQWRILVIILSILISLAGLTFFLLYLQTKLHMF